MLQITKVNNDQKKDQEINYSKIDFNKLISNISMKKRFILCHKTLKDFGINVNISKEDSNTIVFSLDDVNNIKYFINTLKEFLENGNKTLEAVVVPKNVDFLINFKDL